ncbi:MAG: S8 family serine peptidase, partial [Thermoanaerobaculia bacterium]
GKPTPVLVALDGPSGRERIAALEQTGVEVVGTVPPSGYLVRADAGGLAALSELSSVLAVSPYRPEWRISPRLRSEDGLVHAEVIGFAGVDGDVIAKAVIAKTVANAGRVLKTGVSLGRPVLTVEVAEAHLEELAALPEVLWIDVASEGRLFNNQMRVVMQTERSFQNANFAFYNPIYTLGIYGEDEIIAVADSGMLASHQDFGEVGKVVNQYIPPTSCATPGDPQSHGTAVVSNLLGDFYGPISGQYGTPNDLDGLSLRSTVIMQDIVDETNYPAVPPALCPPADIPNDLFQAAYDAGARVHNNSWGHNVTTSNPDTGSYSWRSEEIDTWLKDLEHRESVLVFAAGNFGGDWWNPYPWVYIPRSLSDEAHAKNVITVGAHRSGANRHVMYTFSSRGPTNDCGSPPCVGQPGRVKPDVLAPGSPIQAADSAGPTVYWPTYFGTSFAAPAVSGAAALVRDYFRQGFYPTQASDPPLGQPEPSSALVKAMLVNASVFLQDSSAYTGNVPLGLPAGAYPNYDQGFGRPALDNVLEPAGYRELKVYEDASTELHTGETWSRVVTFKDKWSASCNILRFTLVWTDEPASLPVSQALVNDLDLEVTYQSIVYRGNHGLTGGAVFDTLNNVEDVFLPLGPPPAGVRRIRPTVKVYGSSVATVEDQPFAVVATYGPCFDHTPCPQVGGCYAGPGDVVPGGPPPPGCPGQDYSSEELLPGDEPFPSCDPPGGNVTPIDPILVEPFDP